MASPVTESIITVTAGVVTTFISGPYWGALIIAFVASFTRTAFEDQCGSSHLSCFRRWMRFLVMATGISFLMVSVAAWLKLPDHPAIVLAGFFACFAEETLMLLKLNHKFIAEKLTNRVLK